MSNLEACKLQGKLSPHPNSVLRPGCVPGPTVHLFPCHCFWREGKWTWETGAVAAPHVWSTREHELMAGRSPV